MLGLILLLQTLTLAVSGPATSSEYLPIRVAEAEGYFAREGLEVRVRTTRAESGAAEALAQGQVDLTATTLEALLRSEEHTSELQSPYDLVCRLLLEKKKKQRRTKTIAPAPTSQNLTHQC